MEQPPGFVAQGQSHLVCDLKKSLYSLKQSPRCWFGCFSSVVLSFGLIMSEADHYVFYRHAPSGVIYLVVNVDNIIIIGDDERKISQLKSVTFPRVVI